MSRRVFGLSWCCWRRVLALVGFGLCTAANAASISVGSYPEQNPAPSISIPSGAFLVAVQVTGAANLQTWQFDLLFDNTVVKEVDPGDGSSGIYGAEFVPGDPDSAAFISSGFPSNDLGLVDDLAGFYPSLLTGLSGDGVIAYVMFRFLDGQETQSPEFAVDDVIVFEQVPEPGTLALVALALGLIALRPSASPRRGADAVSPSQTGR